MPIFILYKCRFFHYENPMKGCGCQNDIVYKVPKLDMFGL